MTKRLLLIAILFIPTLMINAQEIVGKVFDLKTLKPLQDVAITVSSDIGTVSDKFGSYTLDLKGKTLVTFSSLGYESQVITSSKLKNMGYAIYLKEAVSELSEIKIYTKKIPLDSIIARSRKFMKKNYFRMPKTQYFNAVKEIKLNLRTYNLDLKKNNSLSRKQQKLAQKEFELFSKNLKDKKPIEVSEFTARASSYKKMFKKLDKYLPEMLVDEAKGYRKSNSKNGISIKNMQQQMITILMKHIDTAYTYKVKSGLFKIEDSLSLYKAINTKDSLNTLNSFTNIEIKSLYDDIRFASLKLGFYYEKNFLSKKYYYHKLENNDYLGDSLYYKIAFKPKKSSAKYTGFVYISPEDYSIKKVTYAFAENKRGDHLNLKWLLGVKYSENINNGSIYFEKTKDNKIYASYLKEYTQKYAYVNRSMKFIENSKRKNKIKLNFKVEFDIEEQKEIVVTKAIATSKDSLKIAKAKQNKKRYFYISDDEYANSDWKNRFYFKEYLKKYE